MTDKIRVLFFVTEFWQAGTQRFTFEVDQALDKARFETTILSFRSLNTIPERPDYYYQKHLDLATQIYFLDEFSQSKKTRVFRKNANRDSLHTFLDTFDVISFMGEYSFHKISARLSHRHLMRSVIHIMNSKHQNPSVYKLYDIAQPYHFCSGFLEDEVKDELSVFEDYMHTYFPLCIHVSNSSPLWSFPESETKKIGVFTRITKTKPLDPFLFAFHLLQNQVPNIELHLFGQPDAEIERVNQAIHFLGISNKVCLHGHVPNMKQTALEEELSLVWFHSYYGVPGGFAGFDITSLGIPQLFWNFTHSKKDKFDPCFPVFSDLTDFVDRSKELLINKEKATVFSDMQFNRLIETRNSKDHISKLEDLYRKIKQQVK